MCRFELLQHAVQGGFGQAGFVHQTLERKVLVFGSNHFEQGKQAQRGRVAVEFNRDGLGGGGHRFHECMIE